MPSAVNQSPGGCQCGACTGSVCVQLTGPCSVGDVDGYTVTIRDHATSAVVATLTTDSAGLACSEALPAGSYDVTATKDDCVSISWTDQAVACGPPLDLSAAVACEPSGGYRKFHVTGCGGVSLPGAVVAITGPSTGSLTTDGSGNATFFPTATGSYSYSVTHPSGRFNGRTGTWTQSTACTAGTTNVAMSAAAGYVCCGQAAAISSPYPWPTTMYLHDPEGSIPFAACGDTVCVSRTMDETSPSTPTNVSCVGGGLGQQPPSPIASGSTMVKYVINLSTLFSVGQSIPEVGSFNYRNDWPSTGLCTPVDTSRCYRLQKPCSYAGALTSYSPTSFTVNSVYPFNATFFFSQTASWGPNSAGGGFPPPSHGGPYTSSLVVSESP